MSTRRRPQTGRRLLHYALLYKKTILAALLLLTVAVGAELSGPLIVKRMIDQHILGIERTWHVSGPGENAVWYDGQWYKREDRFQPGESQGKAVRVMQIGRDYIFVNAPVPRQGTRLLQNDRLIVTHNGEQTIYEAQRLTQQEVYRFYRPEIDDLFRLSLIYMGLLAFATGFQYFQRFLLQVSANRIIQKMRTDVFRQIGRLPIRYFDHLPAGKVVSRITNDTEVIRELYVTVLATFVSGGIYLTGIFVALFLLDVHLAAITLLLVPLLWVWIILYRRAASGYNHRIRALLSDINGMVNETIQGMPVIRAFRRQNAIRREFETMNNAHFQYQNKLLSLNALTSHNLVGVIRNLAYALVIWYFGSRALSLDGLISFGVLYAFIDYLNRMFHPITGIVTQLANLEQARVSAERVFELMDEPGIDVADGAMERYRGNVVFDNVSFAYDKEEYVLKDISFAAKPGETIALVGHTGSGKSSIMNLMFRFYDPLKGRILIDGHDTRDVPRQHLRRHMGIVLQDPYLFTGTIASNVGLDDPSISRERIARALKDVGADRILAHLSKGLNEPVLEKGSTLSAGQRQLISFARALAFDPAILILDEATSSIDSETEQWIQEAMGVLKKGRTTFIIAHRLSTIKDADKILVLDRGQIVEQGTHDQLMALQGRYYQMYRLQHGLSQPNAV